jgi:hypothetical protein
MIGGKSVTFAGFAYLEGTSLMMDAVLFSEVSIRKRMVLNGRLVLILQSQTISELTK